MNSKRLPEFKKQYSELPEKIQKLADKTFDIWKKDNNYPGFEFKRVKGRNNIFSIRIGDHYRALGHYLSSETCIVWVWIGTHEEYNKLI